MRTENRVFASRCAFGDFCAILSVKKMDFGKRMEVKRMGAKRKKAKRKEAKHMEVRFCAAHGGDVFKTSRSTRHH